MYEKILSAIKIKYANLGLSNETLEGIAKQLAGFVKEETEIDAAVTGAEATLKAIQSFGDKRAAYEAERVRKELEKKTDPPKPSDEPPKPEDMPTWAKGIVESVATLKSTVENFNSERQSQTLTQKLTGMLTEKNIPESFSKIALAGRQFKDEAEVIALAELVTTQFEAFKQDSANTGFSYTTPPESGKAPKGDSDELAKMIELGTKTIVEEQKKTT